MSIRFTGTADPPGLAIADTIEQRRLHVETPCVVEPAPVAATNWPFPVDRACTLETDRLTVGHLCSVTIHDASGRTERSVSVGETVEVGPARQFIGLSGPIKLYVCLEGAGTVTVGFDSIRLSVDRSIQLTLGARSPHDRPAHTITTTADPEALCATVSACGSSLKTTSAERTWPTLRGHPPLIEFGDELSIPDSLEPPSPEIELAVPPRTLAICQAAPLAFFLGARLRPSAEPALRAPQFERSLGTERSLGDDLAELLKRFFLLESLTRDEGIFTYDPIERRALEPALSYDLATVYDDPLGERLAQYLAVPSSAVEAVSPRWPMVAYLPAQPAAIEVVPFVLDQLGIVRPADGQTMPGVSLSASADEQLVRSATAGSTRGDAADEPRVVAPSITDDAIEHAWFGAGIPQSATKATLAAYRNQIGHRERSESIDLLVVCNDARMIHEHDLLDDAYGDRGQLPFGVSSEFGASTDRLATLLTDGGFDFLHFIGHATPDGLECHDGYLDVRSLETVDLGVFFLNACQSYEQGLALTERGAYGGVATYADVLNQTAVDAGETMARFLNSGFPLRAACELAREASALGDQYLIVGDGSTDIAQTEGGAPIIATLEESSPESGLVSFQSYTTKEYKIGSVTGSALAATNDYHVTPKHTPAYEIPLETFDEEAIYFRSPVRRAGGVEWLGW